MFKFPGKIVWALILTLFMTGELWAQDETDVLRYNLQYPSYDPVTLVMPGVSSATGFGAYQENPASMAFFDKSFISFGLSGRQVSAEGAYLDNTTEFDDAQANVGEAGFVYKVPTLQGSLVIGGGYSQTTDFNQVLAINGRNEQSTLTDFYASLPRTDPLNQAAFEAYAIEDIETTGGDTTSISIFRLLPAGVDYPGINQIMEKTERGVLGEYSLFAATELQRNLMVGLSLGWTTGSYRQVREFLEDDRFNDYNDQFIDSDGDGNPDTDIASILSVRTIEADLNAFDARLGLVYRLTPNLQIGGSYHLRGAVQVDERFNTEITTRLDNGAEPFFGEDPGEFRYEVERPDRYNLGITLSDLSNLTISASAEAVRYSEARIEFDELDLSSRESFINDEVASSYQDVINLRAGLEYELNPMFTPRVGYAWYPSPKRNIRADRQFFSGGFSIKFLENASFDFGAQYALWEDEQVLYDYSLNGPLQSEIASENISRWNLMGSFKIGL